MSMVSMTELGALPLSVWMVNPGVAVGMLLWLCVSNLNENGGQY